LTEDDRKCVSPCITDPFPEQPNSPEPPVLAQLGVATGGGGSEGNKPGKGGIGGNGDIDGKGGSDDQE
jgi:hypothetical protein